MLCVNSGFLLGNIICVLSFYKLTLVSGQDNKSKEILSSVVLKSHNTTRNQHLNLKEANNLNQTLNDTSNIHELGMIY